MPIKNSAKKAHRVSERKRIYNLRASREMKETMKIALTTKDRSDYIKAQKATDKVCKKGVIKKNTASRIKSRLARNISDNK